MPLPKYCWRDKMKLIASEAMKKVDAKAIGEMGIPEAVLIENAGRAVAALVRGVERIHVSLSHTAENAIAQVLLEG